MRFESATVPAAVIPDHAMRDDGRRNYLPLSRFYYKIGMGRLLKTGISQKTCQTKIFKAFGKKSKESQNDSLLSDSRLLKIEVDFENCNFL